MDDDKIIDLFFERSEQAIGELSKKYGSICKKTAQNILRNPQDSEECVNDCWLSVWNTIPPQRPDSLAGYVCRIVRNIATNKYHFNSAEKRNSFFDVSLDELEEFIPSAQNADEECDAEDLAKAINNFLGTLDRENRIIFVRRFFFSNSLDDIAELFGISKNHVSVKLNRTKRKLKNYLLKEGIKV